MPPYPDALRQKSCLNQYRPQILNVVVHLVVVHFLLWTQPESKCGKFEGPFSSPRRYIDENSPTNSCDPTNLLQRFQRLPQMFDDIVAENNILAVRPNAAQDTG